MTQGKLLIIAFITLFALVAIPVYQGIETVSGEVQRISLALNEVTK